MSIDLVVVGKTTDNYIRDGVENYRNRIARYVNFNIVVIPELKNAGSFPESVKKQKEGDLLCKQLSGYDFVILLDEKGREFTSVGFAGWMEQLSGRSIKRMAFVIGGAYGFSDKVYRLATDKIALSKMTFSHQVIRLLFTEQLYRIFTILNNEPYHHM